MATTITDLGTCLIHTYRAPGDINDSWDIVKQNSDGSFDRAPDARYGPDAPDGEHAIEDFKHMRLVEKYKVLNRNGWQETERWIETVSGEVIASAKF